MDKQLLIFTSDMGYWCDTWEDMPSNTSYYTEIFTGEIYTGNSTLLQISKQEYIPKNGDKVYFLPGVNVPRIKFKNLCDELGIRTVRDSAKANVFIGNNTTLNKITSTRWFYKVKIEDFKTLIENNQFKVNVDTHHYENIKTAIEYCTATEVFVDCPTKRLLEEYVLKEDENLENVKLILVNEQYKELLNQASNFIIYDESTIIDQLNGEDAAIINDAIYKQLEIMLQSKDKDNEVLAMEIMANCKYSSSIVYLILLFYNYGGIFNMAPTKNHVNFKSLLSWLELSPNHTFVQIDDCVKILKQKGQLTTDNLNLLLSYISEDVSNAGDTTYFKVKQITLNEELLSELNENYLYELVKDFEPIVSQEETNLSESEVTEKEESDFKGPEIEDHISEEIIESNMELTTVESFEEIFELETSKQDSEELKQDESQIVSGVEITTNEVEETLITAEPVSNNNQTIQTNVSDDFEWF